MLTPEQQKLFRFLYLFGKSSGVNSLEIQLEYDEILPDEPFDTDEVSVFWDPRNSLKLPQKAAEEFTQFVNENVFPKLDEAFESLRGTYGFDEVSRIRVNIYLDLDKKEFGSDLYVEWYGEEDAFVEAHDLPRGVIDEIQADFPNEEVVQAWIDYSGGGDSGEVEDSMTVKLSSGEDRMESIGPNTLEYVYGILPGGWEIDEGSSGKVRLDLVEDITEVTHTWNSYNSESEEILRFDF